MIGLCSVLSWRNVKYVNEMFDVPSRENWKTFKICNEGHSCGVFHSHNTKYGEILFYLHFIFEFRRFEIRTFVWKIKIHEKEKYSCDCVGHDEDFYQKPLRKFEIESDKENIKES
jgi:hypothetical protein